MRSNIRDIHFYDLEIRPSKEAAVSPPLADVIAHLCELVRNDQSSHKVSYGTEVLTLREVAVDEDNETATLLIVHTDPSAPNAVYSNPETGAHRVLRKRQGEAGEYGAHVVISTRDNPARPNSFLTAVEKVTTLGRALIVRMLNGIINESYRNAPDTFQCEDQTGKRTKDGNPAMVKFRPIIDLTGHPSESFARDLNNGTLTGLELQQPLEQTPIGRRNYLVAKEQQLKVKIVRDNIVANLWNDLKRALEIESNEWSKARIRFTAPDGRPTNVVVDTETGHLLDLRYVKSARIMEIDPPLDNSSAEIVAHLEARMIEALVAERDN